MFRCHLFLWSLFLLAFVPELATAVSQQPAAASSQCVDCHSKLTPNIVTDWKQSRHSEMGISCDTCHGTDHMTAADAAKAKIPTPETCGQCHDEQIAQFKKGKHAMA